MAVPQNDQPALCYPEDLQRNPNLSHDSAASMLMKAAELASKGAGFVYKFIDQPPEGSMWVVFTRPDVPPPQDGVRYLEQEQRYPVALNNGIEMEVSETRFGFIPAKEQGATRVRRRYRVIRGGHPGLVLYHYSRGPAQPVPPQLAMAPIRAYPLRHPPQDVGIVVMGEKQGQRVNMPPRPQAPPQADPRQIALVQQNREMERQRQAQAQAQAQQRAGAAPPNLPPPPPRLEEETDAAEDLEHISTRTLAATRYKRNHDYMSEVFMYAAFNTRDEEKPLAPYKTHFDKSELEDKIAKLTEDLQDLRSRSVRKAAEQSEFDTAADVSMVAA
ncbi:hypothetical protein PENSPDRAFT_754536 [Peniophora sp. CONT]|nr:hypothetical protein PENSPDRAFT_754536 [Peniophora sp. CONT]